VELNEHSSSTPERTALRSNSLPEDLSPRAERVGRIGFAYPATNQVERAGWGAVGLNRTRSL